jgi:hypothetical protein
MIIDYIHPFCINIVLLVQKSATVDEYQPIHQIIVDESFLLSTYEIWKVLVSLAKNFFFFLANFHVLGLFIPKKRV